MTRIRLRVNANAVFLRTTPRSLNRSPLNRSLPQAQKRHHASQAPTFQNWRQSHLKMATARKIQLTPAEAGVFSTEKPTQESADAASRILQENHEVNIRSQSR